MAKRRKNRRTEQHLQERPEGLIFPNLTSLLLVNFQFILFFLPSMILLSMFHFMGGLIFLTGALLMLLPAGPAMAAMFDVGYQMVRRVPKHQRRPFLKSWRNNLWQGMATMAALLPPLAVLLLLSLTAERPIWVNVCLVLGLFLTVSLGILSFSQVALVPLTLRRIWQNSLLLIPAMAGRLFLAAIVFLAAGGALYRWPAYALPGFLFWTPAVLVVWICAILGPKLENLLLDRP